MKAPTKDGARNQFFGMRHLNGELLCALDTGTTGVDMELDEIIEVAILPADDCLKLHDSIVAFHCLIRPENCKHRQETKLSAQKWTELQAHGLDRHQSASAFVKWFESIGLAPGKKIIPLAHNWPFDRHFIVNWLGNKTFEMCFSHLYRDTQVFGGMLNDCAEQKASAHFAGHPYPWQKLTNMCNKHNITVHRPKTVMQDAHNTLQLYQKMTMSVTS